MDICLLGATDEILAAVKAICVVDTECKNKDYDLIVICPEWEYKGEQLRCKCLVSEGGRPLPASCSAQSFVSYGPAAKDTVSFSSHEGDKLVVALMREIISVGEQRVQPCEITLTHCSMELHEALCLAAALLLANITPEKLSEYFSWHKFSSCE